MAVLFLVGRSYEGLASEAFLPAVIGISFVAGLVIGRLWLFKVLIGLALAGIVVGPVAEMLGGGDPRGETDLLQGITVVIAIVVVVPAVGLVPGVFLHRLVGRSRGQAGARRG